MRAYPAATVTLTYEWDRTRYELLDRRSQILREFDQKTLLAAFRPVGSTDLYVDFGGWGEALIDTESISIYGVAVDSETSPRPALEDIALTVGRILDVDNVRVSAAFQHVIGWDEELFEQNSSGQSEWGAYLKGASAFLNGTKELGLIDFALLIDGALDENWFYKAELGVVRGDEVAERLHRAVGRSLAFTPMGKIVQPAAIQPSRVSTFIDSSWRYAPGLNLVPESDELVPLQEAGELVSSVKVLADRLGGLVHARIHPLL